MPFLQFVSSKSVIKDQKYVFFNENLQISQNFSLKINNRVYTIIQDHRVKSKNILFYFQYFKKK